MGNSSQYMKPQAVKKDGTTLAEVKIKHIRDAHDIIGTTPDEYTPVSVVPLRSASECCGCPLCWVSIPHGFFAIVSRFGQDLDKGSDGTGTLESGFHPWWCCCYRVNRLVSRQLIIFDTPVKDCKTQDNITVNIDVLIVFEITKAKEFVYGLGPEKLDELLRCSQEEILRAMAYDTPVEKIYDLHGADTSQYVEAMNKSFDPYGVLIHHFTVREVKIPEDMAKDFEDKTLYESKTTETIVKQKSDQLDMNNDEEKTKLRDEHTNLNMAAREQAVTTSAQIAKETSEVLAATKKEVKLYNAQRDADVQDLLANSELEIAKINAEMMRLRKENQAQCELRSGKLEADATAFESANVSKATQEGAQKISEGRKELASSEGAATKGLSAKREQEQEMKKLDILSKITENESINIVTSLENNSGLAPGNSLVTQATQQGLEAFRMKLAELTRNATQNLGMQDRISGGLVRPIPQLMVQVPP